MKKSRFDTYIFESEEEKAQNQSLGNIGGFLSQESVRTAEIKNLNKPKPGSFGEMASAIVQETMALFSGDSTLSRVAAGQPVGKLFYYEGRLLVMTPFKTIVGGQVYIDTLQNRILELTTVSAEIEIKELKSQLSTVTSGGFLGLIGLAFKRLYTNLLKGKNNG